jgi:hypothetical protein
MALARYKNLDSQECVCTFIHSVSRPFTPIVIQRQSKLAENDLLNNKSSCGLRKLPVVNKALLTVFFK